MCMECWRLVLCVGFCGQRSHLAAVAPYKAGCVLISFGVCDVRELKRDGFCVCVCVCACV